MLIVGERINASRKPIAAAISAQDAAFIKKEAVDQKNAGAHLIDANAGIFVDEEIRYLFAAVGRTLGGPDGRLPLDRPTVGQGDHSAKTSQTGESDPR